MYPPQILHFQLPGSNPVSCTDLYCWLSHNGLCLNPSISDAVLLGRLLMQRLPAFPHITSINIEGSILLKEGRGGERVKGREGERRVNGVEEGFGPPQNFGMAPLTPDR